MTWLGRQMVGKRIAVMDAALGGLAVDIALYALSALFAGLTARNRTLPPHGAWGHIAVWGYAAAAVIALAQAVARRRYPRAASTPIRAVLAAATFAATALAPLLVQAVQRAGGRTDRAQEEVFVVEAAGARMWHTGSPYLSHDAIMALPPPDRLDAYFPYQPGMAVLGLPRAALGVGWWTDARVWFAIVLIGCLVAAVALLRRSVAGPRLLRGVQAAVIFPVCALTLATGGDDMVILGLCLLAFALAARQRYVGAGVVVGLAGAMKLFAWPVALVLLALAAADGARTAWISRTSKADFGGSEGSAWHGERRAGTRVALGFAAGAIGLPIISLIPAMIIRFDAVVENVVSFPLGRTDVVSPAASPLPGHLIAEDVPGGHPIATALLLLAGLAIAVWLIRRPPHDASAAAGITASGLLIAILLIPATRFGYLLYPVAYGVWAGVLHRESAAEPSAAAVRPMAYGGSPASG